MKKKKSFNIVKHLKSLSRSASQTPAGKVIQSKKKKLLKRITKREMHDLE